MDIIIIGKKEFAHTAAPHVVYCGQSMTDAMAAVAATRGEFPNLYRTDGLPFQRIAAPAKIGVSQVSQATTPPTIVPTAATKVGRRAS